MHGCHHWNTLLLTCAPFWRYLWTIPDQPHENVETIWQLFAEGEVNIGCYYYSFKIFPRFWLVKTTRIIHHNQLLFTKFGKKLRRIESMTSKVQPAADYWTDDVKITSKVQPAANYWTVARKKLGTRLWYFCWAEKWLRVGLEVWAKKIFWMNNKAIIEFGFRRIWRILQISPPPWWITPSSTCRILHSLIQ